MKGYTFYEEFATPSAKRKNKSEGNVSAVYGDVYYSGGIAVKESIGAVYFHPNSAVAGTAVSLDYLRKNCKRVSEKKARKIHPMLFERLDRD